MGGMSTTNNYHSSPTFNMSFAGGGNPQATASMVKRAVADALREEERRRK
jgi:hypothetical protein